MKKFMIGVAVVALVSACGNGSPPATDDTASDEVETDQTVARSIGTAFSEFSDIVLRRGNAANSELALAALSLDKNGTGHLDFSSSVVEGDGATFTDITFTLPNQDGVFLLSDIAFDDLEPVNGNATLNIQEMTLDGLDMIDGQAVFSKLSLDGIEIVPNDPQIAGSAQLTIGNFELLNPSPDMATWVASLLGNGAPAPLPSGDALAFDKWSLTDLRAHIVDGGDNAEFRIGSIELRDARAQNLGLAGVSDVALNLYEGGEPRFEISLDRLSSRGGDLGFFDVFRTPLRDENALVGGLLATTLEDPMDPGYDSLDLEGLAINVDGARLSLPDFMASVTRNADGVVTSWASEPYAITLSADAQAGETGEDFASMLEKTGLETIEITGANQSAYDPDADRLTLDIDRNFLSVRDVFSLKFGGEFEGLSALGETSRSVDFAALAAGKPSDVTQADAMVSELTLNEFTVVLEDDSLVERSIALAAYITGQSEGTVMFQATLGLIALPVLAPEFNVDPEIALDVSNAMGNFLHAPGTLTLRLAPTDPLSGSAIVELDDPRSVSKDTLGLTITHEGPDEE